MTTTNNKKAKANENVTTNVENAKATEILAMTAKATEGLIKSNLGTTKSSLFKENVLPTNEKQKKSMRKKLRNVLFSICSTLVLIFIVLHTQLMIIHSQAYVMKIYRVRKKI